MKKQEQKSLYKYGIINIGMDFEEREERRRRQTIKVVIAEIGMFFSVIMIVVVATLAAMGFFVSSNGKIEQTGLMQIHSQPTGATVELDGNTLFSRTNLSRSLSPSDHTLKLSRDGYDTWSKTVMMSSGMLMRLYYPRLFLLNRKSEVALNLATELDFYVPSPDRAYAVYAAKDSASWQVLNLRGDDVTKSTTLDLRTILPDAKNGTFSGEVELLRWSQNNDHILTKISYEGRSEWIVINLKDAKQSLNLTQIFGLDFTQVEMIDNSAAQLFVLENHQLRRININDQGISRVLLNDVESFANYKSDVVYVAKTSNANGKVVQKIGVYHDGEKDGTTLATLADETKAQVALTKYYDDLYLTYAVGDELTVRFGSLPSYREGVLEADITDLQLLFADQKLSQVPTSLTVSPEGDYILAQAGLQTMVLDLEQGELYDYAAAERLSWLDEGILGAMVDGELVVWDFDNTNRRVLVKTVAKDEEVELKAVTTRTTARLLNYPVIISENNRWLYYLTQDEAGIKLTRERIRD